ncbi:hypothetical protein HanRHA438_Chr08g0337841 [Helianthus annuus]|uniref:Uncharacterized protein n=1 Tax=Helianthus annuus TaxID=4232 RepID=A0A9K3NBP9_HELAN|nr:hypothetical protein HanXRQr2_Chr08g0326691 [Helianthus annuus]KAJ0896728.1 hypothetical protein HanRHA438_Chr08g0337841 [Helianthus annuus]
MGFDYCIQFCQFVIAVMIGGVLLLLPGDVRLIVGICVIVDAR